MVEYVINYSNVALSMLPSPTNISDMANSFDLYVLSFSDYNHEWYFKTGKTIFSVIRVFYS